MSEPYRRDFNSLVLTINIINERTLKPEASAPRDVLSRDSCVSMDRKSHAQVKQIVMSAHRRRIRRVRRSSRQKTYKSKRPIKSVFEFLIIEVSVCF